MLAVFLYIGFANPPKPSKRYRLASYASQFGFLWLWLVQRLDDAPGVGLKLVALSKQGKRMTEKNVPVGGGRERREGGRGAGRDDRQGGRGTARSASRLVQVLLQMA